MTEKDKEVQTEEIVEIDTEFEDEESEGRDWKRILVGVFFVLVVVVAWYVIEFAVRS